MIYMFKQMSFAKCNYEIYDKKLLVIVRIFEKWHSKCVDILVKKLIKIINDHQNLQIFMITKQLNRRQARWVEFLSKFNFQIAYRSNAQDAKSNSLTKRSQNLSKSNIDERRQFQHKTILKAIHLQFDMIKIVNLASMLTNDTWETVFKLTSMIYHLVANDLNETSASNDAINVDDVVLDMNDDSNSLDQSNSKQDEAFLTSTQLKNKIKVVYVRSKTLQVIMIVKINEERQIFAKFKKKYSLQMKECKLQNHMLYYKDKLYVSHNEALHVAIIRVMHESFSAKHSKRRATYNLMNRYYYWSRIVFSMTRYVKICYICHRIKIFREVKHDLLKSLLISNRYWQNISCDFIVKLLICKRYNRLFEHIMIIVDKLFKKKKFILMNFLEIEIVVQVFIDFIWREEDYSMSIVSNRDKQFVAHFWRRLCNRLETKLKLFTSFHSKIDEQTKNVNEMLKQYLRVYVNYQQNDWVDYLVVAKFETNNHQSDFIDVVFFMIIKEYLLRSNLKSFKSFENKNISIQRRDMRRVDKIVEKLEAFRSHFRDELIWSQAKQTEYANRDRYSVSKFRIDDNVMLDKRFIDIIRSSHSLDFKNLELFKIIKVIKNHHVYELKLSKSMFEIHFVFHFWLLHLDNSKSLREQHRKLFSSTIIFDVTHHEAIRVIQSRIWRVKKG